ncbi:MAG: CoA transferase [Actinomycetota bacterium]|nr:CoA transferase [Actinomycetota bacterium]
MTGLLDGMRVLDAGIWRPVPHATQMLADLGAQVLKIEPPGGDPMRTFPQLFRDIAGHKRSIELDLRSAEGKARALELVADADVFCEGWRPGVAARLGLSYDDVRARNPSIIYCSVSGYGQTGPNVARPGHDVNYQALAGALAPRDGEEPMIPRVPIADLAAGTIAAFCICAAWAKRIRTGEGERIDVAMADVVASWSGTSSGNVLRGRTQPTRGSAGYGVFACSDGGWITLAVISEDHFWRAVCVGLDLALDLRELRHLERVDRFDECQAAVAAACAGLTSGEALARLTEAGAPVAPVLDPSEMAAHEQFREREVVFDAGDGTARLGFPARLQEHPPRPPGPTPEVDQDYHGWA